MLNDVNQLQTGLKKKKNKTTTNNHNFSRFFFHIRFSRLRLGLLFVCNSVFFLIFLFGNAVLQNSWLNGNAEIVFHFSKKKKKKIPNSNEYAVGKFVTCNLKKNRQNR